VNTVMNVRDPITIHEFCWLAKRVSTTPSPVQLSEGNYRGRVYLQSEHVPAHLHIHDSNGFKPSVRCRVHDQREQHLRIFNEL
jgi:hypothetical protein